MLRVFIFLLPLMFVLSCKDNFIGDPSKNISPDGSSLQGKIFPFMLNGSWYSSSGALTYYIYNSNTIEYASGNYSVIKTNVENSVYRIIAQSNSTNLFYAFYFKDITAVEISAYRSSSYVAQSDAENAIAGTYILFKSTPGTETTFPSGLNKNWYSSGTLTYTISSSNTIQFSGTTYSVVITYVNSSTYKVIGKTTTDSYRAFFFKNILSTTVSAYESGSYSTRAEAERTAEGTYTSYSSTPWTQISFPNVLNSGWHTSNGTLNYLFYESGKQLEPPITNDINTVTASYQSGNMYRIIVRTPSLYYITFFFESVTSTQASIHKSSATLTLSVAQGYTAGAYTKFTTPWPQATFPSALNGNWYTSANLFNYAISGSTSIQTNNIVYPIVTTYVQSGVYKVITKLSGLYYTFYFKSVTSTSMTAYKSASFTLYKDAYNAAQGTFTSHVKK